VSFRMATPRRSKSNSITVRKGIPKDVRSEYQRLYGPGWEAKLSVPAGTPAHEAKIRASEFLAEVETRIATIRAAKRGEGRSLSQRQALALAGEWYIWFVARHEENPGPPERWRDLVEALGDHLMHHAPDHVVEQGWRELDWMREPEVLEGIRPQVADEAKTAQFLAAKALVLSNDVQAMFLDRVLPEFMNAILLLERRAGGDYGADERPALFPKFEGGPRPSTTGGGRFSFRSRYLPLPSCRRGCRDHSGRSAARAKRGRHRACWLQACRRAGRFGAGPAAPERRRI
jgi:hypothetical protein